MFNSDSFKSALSAAADRATDSRLGGVLSEVDWDVTGQPWTKRMQPYEYQLRAQANNATSASTATASSVVRILPDMTVDSTGSAVWSAAVGLSMYLEHLHDEECSREGGDCPAAPTPADHSSDRRSLSGCNVIELGSGTGLCGMVAAHCGAARSTLTDLDEVVPLIEANVRHNQTDHGLPADSTGRVHACALPWGDGAAAKRVVALAEEEITKQKANAVAVGPPTGDKANEAASSSVQRRRQQQQQQQQQQQGATPGVVIAADVIYKREHGGLLMTTIEALLAAMSAGAGQGAGGYKSAQSRPPLAYLSYDRRGREGVAKFIEEIKEGTVAGPGSRLRLQEIPHSDMPPRLRFVHFALVRITLKDNSEGAVKGAAAAASAAATAAAAADATADAAPSSATLPLLDSGEMRRIRASLRVAASGENRAAAAAAAAESERNERRASVALIIRRAEAVSSPSGRAFNSLSDLGQPTAPAAVAGLEVLFIKRATRRGDRWSGDVALPGGKQEVGETAHSAAVREVREEIGLDLSDSNLWMGDVQPVGPEQPALEMAVSCFVFFYVGAGPSPALQLQSSEVAEAGWCPLGCLSDQPSSCVATRGLWGRARFDRAAANSMPMSLLTSAGLPRLLGLSNMVFSFVELPMRHVVVASGRPSSEFRLWGLTLRIINGFLVAARLRHGGDQLPVHVSNSVWLGPGLGSVSVPNCMHESVTQSVLLKGVQKVAKVVGSSAGTGLGQASRYLLYLETTALLTAAITAATLAWSSRLRQ